MWSGHNRDYALLTEERCADLIESIKAQGRQEIPAIVRRLSGDDGYDFEVICGARRHWSISWLRTHNYPDFKFLVDVRKARIARPVRESSRLSVNATAVSRISQIR